MAHGKFEFRGKGGSYFWLFIWTNLLTVITCGIFGPWAVVAQVRWISANSHIDGKQLCFKGSGGGYFANWLLIGLLSIVTLGIYLPWGAVRLFRWVASNTYFADAGDVEYLIDAKKDEKVQFCQSCGSRLPSDALFCEQCGGKVER